MHKQNVLASFQSTNNSNRVSNSIGAMQGFEENMGAPGTPYDAPFQSRGSDVGTRNSRGHF